MGHQKKNRYPMSITSVDELSTLRMQWQHKGLTLVFTNGIFDLLHSGHVRYLEQARALGDVLVVGINSDTSTQALKGPQRPLVPEHERAYLLAALRYVDHVTLFEQPTAETLVEILKPHIYVKGGDYARPDNAAQQVVDETRLPEARVVQRYGGCVILLPYYDGLSTTSLIKRIIERFSHTSQEGDREL
jgi:rfaE bifunctional protein nucleotidyltransferase chain/domain